MSQTYYTLITNLGASLLAKATASGTQVKFSDMAVGDANGTLPKPSAAQTQLIRERRRSAINAIYIDSQNPKQIIIEQVIPPEEGGWDVREIGLFDDKGNLIAVGNCPPSYKPVLSEGSGRTQVINMIIIVDNTSAVELKIDASTVLATRKYVEDLISSKMIVHEQSTNHPNASTTKKGFVQLNSAINSTIENQAATPKAVKEAYDKANTANATAGNALSKTITTPQTVAGEVNFSSSLKSKGFEVLKVGDNGFCAERVSVCSVSFSSLSQMTNGARLFVRDHTATTLPSSAYGYLIKNGVGSAQGEGYFIFVEHGNNGVTWKGFQTNYFSNVVWMKLLSSTDISNYLPTGIPQPWPTSTPPAGWLKCNGATFDKSLYPNLAIAYPAGKLPDLRGEFIRGLDDGRGVDVGRSILSSQGDAMRNFKGEFENNGNGQAGQLPTGPFTVIGSAASNRNNDGVGRRYLFDPSTQVPTANENRPRNIAFLYIVKAA